MQNFSVYLKDFFFFLFTIPLCSLVNSTAFPQETLHWLAKCFLTKIYETVLFPTSYFNHKILEAIAKVLRCFKKHCIARKTSTFTCKSSLLHSPEELCIALAKILFAKSDAIPPRNFAFACKTFSISSKTFAFSRKYNLWFYLIFPSQTYCEQTQKLV